MALENGVKETAHEVEDGSEKDGLTQTPSAPVSSAITMVSTATALKRALTKKMTDKRKGGRKT